MQWVKIVIGLLFEFAFFLLAAECAPEQGPRPVLPTAIPGISSQDAEFSTPSGRRATPTPGGPTSTPAPWATPLPPTPPPPAPGIPHDLAGKDDCLYCHKTKASFGIPPNHARRTNAMCRGCHGLSSSAPQPAPPPIPHSIAGHEACLLCHLQGSNGAPPEPGDHAGRLSETCQTCHRTK